MGEHDRAIELLERAVEVMGRLPFYLGWLGCAYGVAGHTERAEAVLEELQRRSADEWMPGSCQAWVLGGPGRHDAAFEELERGLEERDPTLIGLFDSPPFDPLRDDPRFSDLLVRSGLPRRPERSR